MSSNSSIRFVQTKAEILHLLEQNRNKIKDLGVSRCGLFGSFVRDRANENSDVDVLVSFTPGQKTFDNFMHLSFLLEDMFGRTVDLVTTESLSPYLGSKILQEVEYVSLDN